MMGNRMPQNSRNHGLSNHKLSRAALCAVFSVAGIVGIVADIAAARAGDNDTGDRPYTTFFNKLMGDVGLRDQDDGGIEYKERPPLVVPPSRDLPAPAAAGSLAVKNAEWPSDPDAKKRAAKPKKERAVMTDKPAAAAPKPEGTQQSGGMWSSVAGFGRSLVGNNAETGTFVAEPDRKNLTDPPAGYRTPAATQPYGIDGKTPKKSDIDKQAATVGK
jgi:hypothetical protein